MTEKPKIAVIGDGSAGTALQAGLSSAGYEIQAAGHEKEKVREAAKWGECVVLAVPFEQRQAAVEAMGPAIKGKPLVDVTNTITEDRSLVMDPRRSGAEELQELARGARVVKAFNTVDARHLREGKARGEQLTALIAGDDSAAKERVEQIASDIGFDPVDIGPLSNARWAEALGVLNAELGKESRLGEPVGWRLVHSGAKSERRSGVAKSGGAPPTPRPQSTRPRTESALEPTPPSGGQPPLPPGRQQPAV